MSSATLPAETYSNRAVSEVRGSDSLMYEITDDDRGANSSSSGRVTIVSARESVFSAESTARIDRGLSQTQRRSLGSFAEYAD